MGFVYTCNVMRVYKSVCNTYLSCYLCVGYLATSNVCTADFVLICIMFMCILANTYMVITWATFPDVCNIHTTSSLVYNIFVSKHYIALALALALNHTTSVKLK